MPFSQLNWNGRLTRSAIGFDNFFASSALSVSVAAAGGGAAALAADGSEALACCADAVPAPASKVIVSIAERATAGLMSGGRCASPTPASARANPTGFAPHRPARSRDFVIASKPWSEAERAANLDLAGAKAMAVLVHAGARQELGDEIELRDWRPHEVGGVAARQVIRVAWLDAEIPDQAAARWDGRVKPVRPPVVIARETRTRP